MYLNIKTSQTEIALSTEMVIGFGVIYCCHSLKIQARLINCAIPNITNRFSVCSICVALKNNQLLLNKSVNAQPSKTCYFYFLTRFKNFHAK